MPLDVKESLETIRSHSKNSSLALDNLQLRLIKAKSIQHEISQLKSSLEYLSLKQIRQKEISFEVKIEKLNKIKLQIEELEADPALLPDETKYFYEDLSNQMSTLERKNIASIFEDQTDTDLRWDPYVSYQFS